MLTITVNTIENIHTKFYNNQRDMYINFKGDLLLLKWLCFHFQFRRWFKRTIENLHDISKNENTSEIGIFLSSGYFIYKEEITVSNLYLPWTNLIPLAKNEITTPHALQLGMCVFLRYFCQIKADTKELLSK